MIWNELTIDQQNNLKQQYDTIKYKIKKLNSDKANKSKAKTISEYEQIVYNKAVEKLQKEYETICTDYKCDFCGDTVHLDLGKMKQLFKGDDKPIFCSKQCSGKYYAKKSHEGKTDLEKYIRNKKISDTLKQRELLLTNEQKDERRDKLNAYWNTLNTQQRSIRNTEHCITAMTNNTNNIWKSKEEDLVYNELTLRGYNTTKQYYYKGFVFDLAVCYNNDITLIELNGQYWHNYKPFTGSEEDIAEYNELLSRGVRTQRIANKWRYNDVSKFNCCKENSLNYIVIYFDNQIKEDVNKVCDNIVSKLNNGLHVILSQDLDK